MFDSDRDYMNPYPCGVCGIEFRTRNALAHHNHANPRAHVPKPYSELTAAEKARKAETRNKARQRKADQRMRARQGQAV